MVGIPAAISILFFFQNANRGTRKVSAKAITNSTITSKYIVVESDEISEFEMETFKRRAIASIISSNKNDVSWD